jgi:uncharacterized oligopeptide transporter (OPT) family protein
MNDDNQDKQHPRFFNPSRLFINLFVCVLGAVIGLELITRVGVTPNTSIIGALVAILLANIPLKMFSKYKSLDNQTLLQTSISGATFSAANGLLVPIAIPFVLGKPELIPMMLMGASLAIITDATILYCSFGSKVFPATGTWPAGIATASTLKAAAAKGKSGLYLVVGMVFGAVGKCFGFATDLLGVSWVANVFAIAALGGGLIVRGYSQELFGIDIMDVYLPHGVMIGAGIVALGQIIKLIMKNHQSPDEQQGVSRSSFQIKHVLISGFSAYLVIALTLAFATGIYTGMSTSQFIMWVIFAAFAAIISELIVGISAMFSGWFPSVATALIFLVLGMLIGFPNDALAILVGFTVATGPSFSDMAYDLKAGWIIRGNGEDDAYEMAGRKQQFFAELFSFGVAILVVSLVYNHYFDQNLIPPAAKVYVATIEAGTDANIAFDLMKWAILGGIIQFIGGTSKQIGVLFATGLLINSPIAGIAIFIGLLIRWAVVKKYKEEGQEKLYILGAGLIAGSALYSFFASTLKLNK